MNSVTCIDLRTGKEFTRYFYDLKEQHIFMLRCKHSRKVMIVAYTCENEEDRLYVGYGVF